MSIKKLHADFLEDLEIGLGRSQKTVENYDRYLSRFYDEQHITEVRQITAEQVRSFRRWLNEETSHRAAGKMVQGVSLATQNYHLIALRQFLKYLAKRDVPSLAPDKVGLAKLAERDIDVLYPEEVDRLLHAAKHPTSPQAEGGAGLRGAGKTDLAGFRDLAILEVLFATGMRVAELTSLNRDDIPKDSGEFPVRGKGGKVRVVFLSNSAGESVLAYLSRREDIDPALFVRHGPNMGNQGDLRLTTRSVQRLMKKYAVLAGLTKEITPHTLRHSFATDLLSNGADVRQVQQLLGHASITTTQAYTHLTDVHLKEVHGKYHRRRPG